MRYHVFGQESSYKGIRLVRFLKGKGESFRWIGEVGKEDDPPANQFLYNINELLENNWVFIEEMN